MGSESALRDFVNVLENVYLSAANAAVVAGAT
jgi:hypothetical protein